MIYFIQAALGPIKIGFTNNWQRRRIALQNGTHERLDTLLVVPGGIEEEQAVLGAFAAHRIRGEWFRPAPQILAYVESRRGECLFPLGEDAAQAEAAERRKARYARSDANCKAAWTRAWDRIDAAVETYGVDQVAAHLHCTSYHLNRVLEGSRTMSYGLRQRVLKCYANGAVATDSVATEPWGAPSSCISTAAIRDHRSDRRSGATQDQRTPVEEARP